MVSVDSSRVDSAAAVTAVEVRDLRKNFGPVEAVRGISFDVHAGEVFGFLGPNGAGKSTTISMLCTLLRATGGSARVAGFDIARQKASVRRSIGLVFQDTTLDDYLTAEQNLVFHAELYGVPATEVQPRADHVLTMVGLADRRKSLVRTFSGGMKRRLEIARGLLHAPRVLFLDEPTIGLDPQTRATIWNYINDLRRREDITIFLTTHYMDEAEYCDRIAIIDVGRIVALDTPSALKASVGADRISIRTVDVATTMRTLKERFDIESSMNEDQVTFHVANGEEFVPQLFALGGLSIQAVSVARPTLDDVFMNFTGRTIREAEASESDRLRAQAMIWHRRR